MRKKFKIHYSRSHPDKDKAGKQYNPKNKERLLMSPAGVFFLYFVEGLEDEAYPLYPLATIIGSYDVRWVD